MSYPKIPKQIKTIGTSTKIDCKNVVDPPIFKLNDDCMRHILSFLPIVERIRVQRVCKKWNRLSELPWTDMKELKIYGVNLAKEDNVFSYSIPTLKQILRLCGRSLIDIKFVVNIFLAPTATLRLLKQYCPNLRSLDLSGITLNSHASKFLAGNFTDLTSICLGKYKAEEDEFYNLFSANTKLRSLSIYSNNMTGKCLQGLSKNSVEEFKITNCFDLSIKQVSKALKRLMNLRTFSIFNNELFISELNVYLDIFSEKSKFENLEIGDRFPWMRKNTVLIPVPDFNKIIHLKELKLNGHEILHDELLKSVATHCKKLSKVSLSCSATVTDQPLQNFLNSLSSLEDLEIYNLEKLSEYCFDGVHVPSLKFLKLNRLPHLTYTSFQSIIQFSEKLERIEIMNCENVDYLTVVTNAHTYMIGRCPYTKLELFLGMNNMSSGHLIKVSSQLKIIFTENKSYVY